MPLIERKLAGYQRRLPVVAIVQNLLQIANCGFVYRRQPEVVNDEQLDPSQLTQERGALLQGQVANQFIDQSRYREASHRDVGSAGGMRQTNGQVTLADAGGPGDQLVQAGCLRLSITA